MDREVFEQASFQRLEPQLLTDWQSVLHFFRIARVHITAASIFQSLEGPARDIITQVACRIER